ncbi:MAG: tyrosine--tRNA ligase [Candidatus Babeliaceae bacterium]|nr:tyrosine--tRNA ligase [Candidatus Babeliaceae bacterium]
MKNVQELIQAISIGTQEIFSLPALEKKIASNKKLIIKFGADPTAPDLHLGHAVVLSKLRQLQDLGHHIIFLIGDFTARIGDPTGRSKTRPPLTQEQIQKNSKTYLDQVGKILDTSKSTIAYNSTWLSPIALDQWLKICGQVTVARIIEREDFAKRLAEQTPIGMHELMYPLLQGYDSIALKADIELGGTDQTFNLLMGRHLQEAHGMEGQVCITLPLLEGLDGVQKMSKSYGNIIGLAEPAQDAFGKLMSISDTLMWRYYILLLLTPYEKIVAMQNNVIAGTAHPMDLKKQMAFRIVERFWSKPEAENSLKSFEQLFQKRDYSHALHVTISPQEISIIELVKQLPEKLSSTEIRRRIQAGAISVDGEKITDITTNILPKTGMVIKVGKHAIYKIS